MDKHVAEAIREYIAVPAHIHAAANACRYDLLHGPSWARIPQCGMALFTDDCFGSVREDLEDDAELGDSIAETYTGPVGDALREFIADLPGTLWVDTDCGCVSEREPDSYEEIESEDDDGNAVMETVEVDLSSTWEVSGRDIVEALFGRTIAREFN